MAVIKYDVSGVESQGDFPLPTPGMYRAKIKEINEKESKAGNEMLEVVLQVSKGDFKDAMLWTYVLTDHEPSAWKLKEFIDALGRREKGSLDTSKIVGTELQVRVKSDTDLDGNYRPSVGKLMALPDNDDDDEEQAEEPEEEEETGSDDDADSEGSESDEDDDYDEWEVKELKDELKTRGLRTGGKKSVLISRLRKDDEADEDGDEPF